MKRFISFMLSLVLVIGLLSGIGPSPKAAESKGLAYYAATICYERAKGKTDTKMKTVELHLGDLVFEGFIINGSAPYLTMEEIQKIKDDVLRELGISEEALVDYKELENWLWLDQVELAAEKLLRMGANFLPGDLGDAAFAAGVVEKLTATNPDYKGIALDTALTAAGKGTDHIKRTIKIGSQTARGNVVGALVVGGIGAGIEAADNTQYNNYVKKLDQKLIMTAQFYALCIAKMKILLRNKYNNQEGGFGAYISFTNAEQIVENRSLLGIDGLSAKYTLSGMLQMPKVSVESLDDINTGYKGTYDGTLYLTVEGQDLESLDRRFADSSTLWKYERYDEWRQILHHFNDNFGERWSGYAIHDDHANIPTTLRRSLAGDFTAVITAEDGVGNVALRGAFNNKSDVTFFDFDHYIYYTTEQWWRHVEEDKTSPTGIRDYGVISETIHITSIKGLENPLEELHVQSSGNEALERDNWASHVMFQGSGRPCVVPKEGQGDMFDRLQYAPTMEVKERD